MSSFPCPHQTTEMEKKSCGQIMGGWFVWLVLSGPVSYSFTEKKRDVKNRDSRQAPGLSLHLEHKTENNKIMI